MTSTMPCTFASLTISLNFAFASVFRSSRLVASRPYTLSLTYSHTSTALSHTTVLTPALIADT